MIYRTVTVEAKITDGIVSVTPTLSGNISADAEVINVIRYSNMDEYEGPYEVTPTEETQVLPTEARTLIENIIVNPIPSNYGRIVYNGSVITVY